MTPQQRFGANLRRLRDAAGLTQQALWDATGINMTEISRLEHEHKDPRLSTIVRLSVGLNLPPEALVTGVADGLSSA